MKVGIYDLNDCTSLEYKERLSVYKENGFSSVGVYLDDNYMANGENYLDIIDYARKIGLEVNQVHVDYKISNLICDDTSNIYFDYVEEKLNECIQLGISYMVLHASKGNDAPLISEIGIEKLSNLMRKYDGSDVYLCFENVRDNRNLNMILKENINNVGMCYDMGHAHCYGDENEILMKYKNKILCTHLHNNNKKDTHDGLFEGEIDSKKIISFLNKFKKIDNCLEIFPERGKVLDREEFIGFVKGNYNDYMECVRKNKR